MIMKINERQLRNIIREELAVAAVEVGEDPQRFLHGHDSGHPHDDEGYMLKLRLAALKKMACDLCDAVKMGDQLPGWVQDHIAVAHENLHQVHGYLTGVDTLHKWSMK